MAHKEANDLVALLGELSDIQSMQGLLVAAKMRGPSKDGHGVKTEQARRLKDKLEYCPCETRISPGTFGAITPLFPLSDRCCAFICYRSNFVRSPKIESFFSLTSTGRL